MKYKCFGTWFNRFSAKKLNCYVKSIVLSHRNGMATCNDFFLFPIWCWKSENSSLSLHISFTQKNCCGRSGSMLSFLLENVLWLNWICDKMRQHKMWNLMVIGLTFNSFPKRFEWSLTSINETKKNPGFISFREPDNKVLFALMLNSCFALTKS